MERAEILSLEKRLKDELFKLISIPSHRDCSQIQEYLKDRLNFIKFEDQKINKNNLYNIYSISPEKPILINTHVDTVPPINMKDPFKPYEKNGRIYGRGAADTKGLIAALIIALEDFYKKYGFVPVSIAFTVDEEQNTALGSQELINVLEPIESILVLEPTYGKLCTAQMGTYEFRLKVNLPSAHASEFEKFKNPAKEAFKAINLIEKELNRPVNILRFNSGWEHYAVPDKAEVLCEFKIFENELVSDIESKLTDVIDNLDTQIEIIVEDYEEFNRFKKGQLIGLLKKAYQEEFNTEAKEGIMPSWTDASNYHKAGFECGIFGFADLSISHSDRESISIEELIDNYRFLYRFFSILTQP